MSWILTEELKLPQARLQYELWNGKLLLFYKQRWNICDVSTGSTSISLQNVDVFPAVRDFDRITTTIPSCVNQISDELIAFGYINKILIYNIRVRKIIKEIPIADTKSIDYIHLLSNGGLLCKSNASLFSLKVSKDKIFIYHDFKYDLNIGKFLIAITNDEGLITTNDEYLIKEISMYDSKQQHIKTLIYPDLPPSRRLMVYDNEYLYSVNQFHNIIKWSLNTGEVLTSLDTHDQLKKICIFDDYILTYNNSKMKIWNMNLECEAVFNLCNDEDQIVDICVLQDSRISVSISDRSTVIYSLL